MVALWVYPVCVGSRSIHPSSSAQMLGQHETTVWLYLTANDAVLHALLGVLLLGLCPQDVAVVGRETSGQMAGSYWLPLLVFCAECCQAACSLPLY